VRVPQLASAGRHLSAVGDQSFVARTG